jgi:hypothetical protein
MVTVFVSSTISVIIGLKDKLRVKENQGHISLYTINKNNSDI